MNVKMKIIMKDISLFVSLDMDGVTTLPKGKIWYIEGRNLWNFTVGFDVIVAVHKGLSH